MRGLLFFVGPVVQPRWLCATTHPRVGALSWSVCVVAAPYKAGVHVLMVSQSRKTVERRRENKHASGEFTQDLQTWETTSPFLPGVTQVRLQVLDTCQAAFMSTVYSTQYNGNKE